MVLGVFLAAAIVCFGVSAGFHTLLCHSEKVAGLWLQFDFLGIVAMIEGCFVSGIYVTFYCEPGVMHIYWGMVSKFVHPHAYIYIYTTPVLSK